MTDTRSDYVSYNYVSYDMWATVAKVYELEQRLETLAQKIEKLEAQDPAAGVPSQGKECTDGRE